MNQWEFIGISAHNKYHAEKGHERYKKKSTIRGNFNFIDLIIYKFHFIVI